MPTNFQGITDAIGGIFDSPVVQLGLRAIAVYWVIFWLAAAYWAFRDLQLRTENPVLPYFAAAFIIVFTPILFPAAIFIYRIVRPHERIDEVYERTLAQEALIAEIEVLKNCPNCRRRVHDDWIVCPTCRTRLNRVCPNCGKLVGLDWSLCAWCGRDFERRETTASPAAVTSAGDALPASRRADPPAEPAAVAARDAGTADSPRAPNTPGVTQRPVRSIAPRSAPLRGPADRPAPGPLPER